MGGRRGSRNEKFRPGTEAGKATEFSWTGQTPAFCSLLEGQVPRGTCNQLVFCAVNAVSLESAIIILYDTL